MFDPYSLDILDGSAHGFSPLFDKYHHLWDNLMAIMTVFKEHTPGDCGLITIMALTGFSPSSPHIYNIPRSEFCAINEVCYLHPGSYVFTPVF